MNAATYSRIAEGVTTTYLRDVLRDSRPERRRPARPPRRGAALAPHAPAVRRAQWALAGSR